MISASGSDGDGIRVRRRITWLPGTYAVCRLDPGSPFPKASGAFFAVTRTADEVSVVCPQEDAPAGSRVESGWKAMKLDGPIPFAETGVLASLAAPLATAGVSIFAVSTFDTDYLLVRQENRERALGALEAAGFSFGGEP